ncbi:hypothetical protein H4R33_000567 [Dimargaris cristalligena]|uniref:Uncharacterized protein n=1 Tax=Dimargaris cristalligena TaxID=215637 RepID=A0A4V1J542_9FUNG|nr:hypothetical protein H4R33_000567 [Dimargaris cristalligena]RKP37749.1 hypothetical protein BJ085DRAFT_30843 [Dimargaris cristalligena]|eukprot:RKP37749.1 hypothetical protein BJ085DRAFT_30843 [Dimargaris cristalligena]
MYMNSLGALALIWVTLATALPTGLNDQQSSPTDYDLGVSGFTSNAGEDTLDMQQMLDSCRLESLSVSTTDIRAYCQELMGWIPESIMEQGNLMTNIPPSFTVPGTTTTTIPSDPGAAGLTPEQACRTRQVFYWKVHGMSQGGDPLPKQDLQPIMDNYSKNGPHYSSSPPIITPTAAPRYLVVVYTDAISQRVANSVIFDYSIEDCKEYEARIRATDTLTNPQFYYVDNYEGREPQTIN